MVNSALAKQAHDESLQERLSQLELRRGLEGKLEEIRKITKDHIGDPQYLKENFLSFLKPRYNSDFLDFGQLRNAFDISHHYHKDGKKNKRDSGHPYLTHLLSSAYIVYFIGADSLTTAAMLLHDVFENNGGSEKNIERDIYLAFGDEAEEITGLVMPMTHDKTIKDALQKKYDTSRRIISAGKKDEKKRPYLLRVGDRLDNNLTLDFVKDKPGMPAEKRRENTIIDTKMFVIPMAKEVDAYYSPELMVAEYLADLANAYIQNRYRPLNNGTAPLTY